jgi:hypothetical protein
MAIVNLFSKRQKVLRKEVPDVYQYTEIPRALRVQIIHILRDVFGFPQGRYDTRCIEDFQVINDALCREYGVFGLSQKILNTVDEQVVDFLLTVPDHEKVLDVIEIAFRLMVWKVHNGQLSRQDEEDAISELNARFREHGVGYQHEAGEIIRVDSQLIHAQVVKPALVLLTAKEYAGANAEFLKAFEHYRKGDTKGCLNECLKAFESTMKAICTKRNWAFKPTDAAKELIDVCLKNGLIPPLIQSHIGGVRAALESGIPTVRNRLSGHGQGAKVIDVPSHYASYMLHLTATTIQYLVESEKALK